MKRTEFLLVVIAGISLLVLAACGGQSQGQRPAPPTTFAILKNSQTGEEAAAAGQALYQANCASCHGETGTGDGVAAQSLNPKPKDLSGPIREMSDGYLYWRMAEGGAMAPFYSAMPAWKNQLREEQIWQIITYLRQWE